MKPNQKVYLPKDKKEVSEKLRGTYGKTIVIMTSNPEELDILSELLKDKYDVVMDTDIIDNGDYAKVIVRKD